LPTPGSWHDHDRRRIEALLTEMARKGLECRRGFDFPDLRDLERDIRTMTKRLGTELCTLDAWHVARDHMLLSSRAVAPVSASPTNRYRPHAQRSAGRGVSQSGSSWRR